METKPYNRRTHYSKSKKSSEPKDYYSLRSLSKEIFPYISEERAYRNTLANFKEACSLIGKSVDDYRTKKNSPIRIPSSQKTAIMLLIRHISIYKTGLAFKNQDYDKITEYAKDLIETKDAIDRADFANMEKNMDDYANFYDLFYSSSEIRLIIAHQLKMEVTERLMKDFTYIAEKVPEDRATMYTEFYRNEIQRAIKKASAVIRKMNEEQWYNQIGNE
ncbi:hypothetical protein NYE69_02480 [Paenibacillus sp. FSL R5-0527]|uniref:hypothetical protein n=1 Tax=Paenibacillus sp. FSL R5-0527 TaxID=2975321 RepID=UPI00097BA230|nr:hypothetical protein BK140_27770 [Paenibacillus macerans]